MPRQGSGAKGQSKQGRPTHGKGGTYKGELLGTKEKAEDERRRGEVRGGGGGGGEKEECACMACERKRMRMTACEEQGARACGGTKNNFVFFSSLLPFILASFAKYFVAVSMKFGTLALASLAGAAAALPQLTVHIGETLPRRRKNGYICKHDPTKETKSTN